MARLSSLILLTLCAGVFSQTAPVTQNCEVEVADVIFILDASGSVSSTQWKQELDFAKEVVKGFDIGPQKVRVALVEFASQATIQAAFDKYTSVSTLVAGIDVVNKSGGGTATDLALDLIRTQLLPQTRQNVPVIVIVITDGGSNSKPATATAAALVNKQTTVFSVGVGNAVDTELKAIASDDQYVFTYTDFSQLLQLQKDFEQQLCQVIVKQAPTTTPTTTVPGSGCSYIDVDIVLAVDTSLSVGLDNFNLTKQFLQLLMSTIDLNSGKTKVGLIKFNDATTTEFELNQNNDLTSITQAIANMAYNAGSGTVISSALKHMREQSFTTANGNRAGVADIGIVITDGQASDRYRTYYEANKTKDENILLFTVGIGDDIDQDELKAIASSPNDVFIVKSYAVLNQIVGQLANRLCKGYTLPPSTTAAPQLCTDAIPNCQDYKDEICFLDSYRTWSTKNCAAHCDLCPAGTLRYVEPPLPCADKRDCNGLLDVCTDPQYAGFALGNCARYCNLCHLVNKPAITQPPTTPSTTPPSTTPTTTQTTTPTTTTPYTCCDPACCDVNQNCAGYGQQTCLDPVYQPFMAANCMEYCGLCVPIPACIKAPEPCQDKIDCSAYDDSVCFDPQFEKFMKANCNKRCFCGPNPATTAAPSTVCEDKEDCASYGADVCTDFKDFSARNCRAYCKICIQVGATKPPCVDKITCGGYDLSTCTNPDYRAYMIFNCRKYCNLCDAEV